MAFGPEEETMRRAVQAMGVALFTAGLLAACGGDGSGTTGSTTTGAGGGTTGAGGMTGTGGAGGAGGGPNLFCVPGSMQPCYTGPAATQGVGVCAPGMQTCAPDGQSYGPCMGETLPSLEDCGTAADESCDGAGECAGATSWSKRFGDADYQQALGVAVDGAGNVILSGGFIGAVDFGGGPLAYAEDPDAPANDLYLAKLDGGGNHLWSKRFGDTFNQTGLAVAADAMGNIYVTGAFASSLDL